MKVKSSFALPQEPCWTPGQRMNKNPECRNLGSGTEICFKRQPLDVASFCAGIGECVTHSTSLLVGKVCDATATTSQWY